MSHTYRTRDLSSLSVDDLRHFLGERSARKLAHSTYIERGDDGAIGIRLHSTRILTFHPDGSFTAATGGWETTTTKQRLNALMPAGFRIYARRYRWMIATPEGEFEFCSGDRWNLPAAAAPDVEPALDYSRTLGALHGTNAAAWFFDGNTSAETYSAVLAGLEDGDPEVLDTLPAPDLSGEWADTLTGLDLHAQALRAAGLDAGPCEVDVFDEVCDAYETAFSDAVASTVEWTCRRMLEGAA